MKRFLVIIIASVTLCAFAKAQVTIGCNEEPANGALLHLKEIERVNSVVQDASKGLLLPRVKLSSLNKLYPMYKGNSSYESGGTSTISNINNANIGLLVYNYQGRNIPPVTGLENGLYVWMKETKDGADSFKWSCLFKSE